MESYKGLVERFGTPLYVYELSEIRSAYEALRSSLPEGSRLYYSLKANPHQELAAELQRLGCHAEVSSIGELSTALDAGYRPEQCLYTGPGKTYEEIAFALGKGVTWFSVESSTDLRRVANASSSSRVRSHVLLRVNVDEPMRGLRLQMTGVSSQFGVDASSLIERSEEFTSSPWAVIRGFHFYAGTQIMDTEDLLATFYIGLQIIRKLSKEMNIVPEVVDLGGGFGHPYAVDEARPDHSSLKGPLESALEDILPGWSAGSPHIAFESGRYLVGRSGTLLCTVQDVKESKGTVFVVLDSGINHLGGMAGLRRVPRPMISLISTKFTAGGMLKDACIVGPLCTPLDSWSKGVDIPRVSPGDVVAIPNVGAYGLSASLIAFLGRSCPIEVIIENGRVRQTSQIGMDRHLVEVDT